LYHYEILFELLEELDVIGEEFHFPVGYHQFHKEQVFNFQLNRWYSLGYARFEDIKEFGQRINTFEEWKTEMLKLGDKAVAEDRLMNAAFYYRAAEFYTLLGDPDKDALYDKFIDLFYQALRNDEIERLKVPYEDAYLPTIRIRPTNAEKKGTIVMHGGFDSFIEELNDVTWLGISMGGWFCLRAAAFEPRIKRVMASSIAFDYMQMPNFAAQQLAKLFFIRFRKLTNRLTLRKMTKDKMHAWSVSNMMYIADKKTPVDAMDVVLQLNKRNLHSELVKQDVLILTGREDHFIPFKMHDMQVKALINARSVTGRVFTREEQAQNHCQIGNIGLALDVMVKWIEEKS